MIVNEIHAPYYIVGKFATPVFPTGHNFRLYFKTGTVLTVGDGGDEDNWRITRGGIDIGSVAACVNDLFTRAATNLPEHTHVTQIELWQSVPDAGNLLVHINTLPLGNDYGNSPGIASSYVMYVFGTALRPQFRFTFFDGSSVAPQRYPAVSAPTVDNSTIYWFFTKSNWGMANNDGLAITRNMSTNTGYNRALAKKYGKSISP